MAAVDKITEVCGIFLLIFLITQQASAHRRSGYHYYATCYRWTNSTLISSYCRNPARTKCCYETCCDRRSYYSHFSFVTCPHPTYNPYLKQVCKDYRKTDCCPHVQWDRRFKTWTTRTWLSTCCSAKPTSSKVVTYGTCYGSYSTGYCTDSSSTSCCYESCCNLNDYHSSFSFATCGYSTCRNYWSTSCCTETSYPWMLKSCCRSTAATWATTTTTKWETRTARNDESPSTGTPVSVKGILAAAGVIFVVLVVVSSVLCARRSAQRNRRNSANQDRRCRLGGTVSPIVSALTPTAGRTGMRPQPGAYVNPAMQFPDLPPSSRPCLTMPQGQVPNFHCAEPPPTYDDAVFTTVTRPSPFNPDKDPPPYDPGSYPRILAVAPVVATAPPPYTSVPDVRPSES